MTMKVERAADHPHLRLSPGADREHGRVQRLSVLLFVFRPGDAAHGDLSRAAGRRVFPLAADDQHQHAELCRRAAEHAEPRHQPDQHGAAIVAEHGRRGRRDVSLSDAGDPRRDLAGTGRFLVRLRGGGDAVGAGRAVLPAHVARSRRRSQRPRGGGRESLRPRSANSAYSLSSRRRTGSAEQTHERPKGGSRPEVYPRAGTTFDRSVNSPPPGPALRRRRAGAGSAGHRGRSARPARRGCRVRRRGRDRARRAGRRCAPSTGGAR